MSGFQELETAVLYKRYVSARQLKFKLSTMVRSSEQRGLRLQGYPGFPGSQNFLRNVPGLRGFIFHGGQQRLLLRPSLRSQVFRKSFVGKSDDLVAGVQDRLG